MATCLTPQQFTRFLDEQTPIYDQLILRDIRPTDGWIGHVSVGSWDPYDGISHTKDRFKHVEPDVSKEWVTVDNAKCSGAPCDPTAHEIGMGYTRDTYYQERQSWKSQLFCFDQILTLNKAKEHMMQFISDVLRPATSRIQSFYLRKRCAQHAGSQWVANSTMSAFTHTWSTVGDREIYITTTAEPTSKITPQMLQRRVAPLRNKGYFGKWTNDPFFGGYSSMIELVTDDETAWELDKVAQDLKVSQSWRFQLWDAAHDYYKYGMGGQLGNYMVRIDPFPLRFNKVSSNYFQLVLPYKNVAATEGIGSEDNADFHNAQYQFSIIHHRMALKVLVQRMESINPLMPFAVRDLSGQWRFATNDLGKDCNGNPIANFRGNKGFFYADFQLAIEKSYVEWEELIFHKREPAYVVTVDTCNADPGHPTQYYDSANDGCGDDLQFTPTEDGDGNYVLAQNTATCDGNAVTHVAISSATVDALATAMNADAGLGALGTWVAVGQNLNLVDTTCDDVVLPWVV